MELRREGGRRREIEKETGRQIYRHTNRWRERQRCKETDTYRWRGEGAGRARDRRSERPWPRKAQRDTASVFKQYIKKS